MPCGPGQAAGYGPLAKAKRSVLIIEEPDTEVIYLPIAQNCGFEAAFPETGGIDFSVYDSRFLSVKDRDFQLDMAISRLLYPTCLGETSKAAYEKLVRSRFRPAMLLLTSGKWNLHGILPEEAEAFLSYRKMDRFLEKELFETASQRQNLPFLKLLYQKQWRSGGTGYRCKDALAEIAQRLPELQEACVLFQGMPCQMSSREVLHSLLHFLYLHPFINPVKGASERDRMCWNLACDIAVEYAADQLWGASASFYQERQAFYSKLRRSREPLTARNIARWISVLDSKQLQNLLQWFSVDVHENWPVYRISTSLSFEEREAIQQKLEKQKKDWAGVLDGSGKHSKLQGGWFKGSAGSTEEEANLRRREGHDYGTFLRQFMTEGEMLELDLDSFDPVYYTFGLRQYEDMPFIEPLETKEVCRLEELAIVIDTSGSCSGRLVRFFLEETWSVFLKQENFFDHFQVRILQCDAIVQEDYTVHTIAEAQQYMENLRIRGGGGTDFQAAFRYLKQLQKKGQLRRLKGVLYFMDGFGTFPKEAPPWKTSFIFLRSRFGQVELPYWANKLLLDVPEGEDWNVEYTGGFQVNISQSKMPPYS